MMENTAKLLDEIAKLKKYKHQVGKALARIEHRCDSGNSGISEKTTLETVLRIFEEEVK